MGVEGENAGLDRACVLGGSGRNGGEHDLDSRCRGTNPHHCSTLKSPTSLTDLQHRRHSLKQAANP
jgi:hypothetical protein